MTADKPLVLASGSPRRRELLQQIGVQFEILPLDVDEGHHKAEAPDQYVQRLACLKATTGSGLRPDRVVLGADTTVVIGGRLLGKPGSEKDALDMLMSLAGKTHQVFTAVALANQENVACSLSETRVTFCDLTEAECRRYWQTGEPLDKAGAYGIQGYGAVFVTRIEGSYSGVVGLPLEETRELLEQFHIPYWQQVALPS